MLDALKNKFEDKDLTLILGSYFDVEFESDAFDAVVSVESLHHFTKAEKIPLYQEKITNLDDLKKDPLKFDQKTIDAIKAYLSQK